MKEIHAYNNEEPDIKENNTHEYDDAYTYEWSLIARKARENPPFSTQELLNKTIMIKELTNEIGTLLEKDIIPYLGGEAVLEQLLKTTKDEKTGNGDEWVSTQGYYHYKIRPRLLELLKNPDAAAKLLKPEHKEKAEQFKQTIAQFKKYDEERQAIINTIIDHNYPLVIKKAVSLTPLGKNYGLTALDLFQEGILGFARALEQYDPEHPSKAKVTSYALYWIVKAMHHALSAKDTTVKIPEYILTQQNAIEQVKHELAQKLQREPSHQEISDETGIPLKGVEKLLTCDGNAVSLNTPIKIDALRILEPDEGIDVIPDDRPLPLDLLEIKDIRDKIQKILESKLAPREIKVMELYYGLQDGVSVPFYEIAAKLHLSRERVRQTHNKALRKLRANPEAMAILKELL